MGTTSVTAPIAFTGASTYSSDFQSILTRAVRIASLPLTQLSNRDADIASAQTQLSTFGESITSLSASFASLATAVSTGGIQATSSDRTIVTANASAAQTAATYTINSVTSLATSASETSTAGFANSNTTAVSANGALKLVVGSKSYNLNLTAAQNNLSGIQNAINSLGAGVTASILTTGTGANANYLSISANSNGQQALQLFDDPHGANTNLLTAANPGSDAVFKLDGITVDRTSNVVNDVVPGLSFTLVQKATTPVTLSLSQSRSALSSALSNFVNTYNAVADQVTGQVGKGGGLLSGNSIVQETASALRRIASYSSSNVAGSTNVQSLSDLGVTFDPQGHASFDATNLNGFNDAQLNSAFAFVGTASKGFASLNNNLTQLSDPVTGLIKAQQDSYDSADKGLKLQISDLQDRISVMQAATTSRLQRMDALVASLQSQQQVITASIQSVNLALFGKNPST